MESIFGTIRRNKKKSSDETHNGNGFLDRTSSTPNLLKIQQSTNNNVNSGRFHINNASKRSPGSFSQQGSPTPRVPKGTGSNSTIASTSSLRRFVSMMTLKRSRSSIRKHGFGSTATVNSLTPSHSHFGGGENNTEPGVGSSSSSETSSVYDPELLKDFTDPVELERQRTLLVGTKKFNSNPKSGIEFLVEKGIIEMTKEDVARFLKEGPSLSKSSIGKYLGGCGAFLEGVLQAYCSLHSFEELNLAQALREFLWGFRLPGESQQISRILDAFAEQYCTNNPNLFETVDACSVLCYSVIMLNTELHNPNVKDKISLAQFITRNKGIEGINFQDDFMTSLYNSVLHDPFRFPLENEGDDYMLTFFNPDCEGWLWKLGGRPKSWKRKWFILSNSCLYYFKFTTDKTPSGIIPLENVVAKAPPEKENDNRKNKMAILILQKESPHPKIVDHIKSCKTVGSKGETMIRLYSSIQLGVSSARERDHWVKAINATNSMSRFYSDLTLKKMRATNAPAPLIRKSQIGLPNSVLANSSTSTTSRETSTIEIPIPAEVLENPEKDPNNFFTSKNLLPVPIRKEGEENSISPIPSPTPSLRRHQINNFTLLQRLQEDEDLKRKKLSMIRESFYATKSIDKSSSSSEEEIIKDDCTKESLLPEDPKSTQIDIIDCSGPSVNSKSVILEKEIDQSQSDDVTVTNSGNDSQSPCQIIQSIFDDLKNSFDFDEDSCNVSTSVLHNSIEKCDDEEMVRTYSDRVYESNV